MTTESYLIYAALPISWGLCGLDQAATSMGKTLIYPKMQRKISFSNFCSKLEDLRLTLVQGSEQ